MKHRLLIILRSRYLSGYLFFLLHFPLSAQSFPLFKNSMRISAFDFTIDNPDVKPSLELFYHIKDLFFRFDVKSFSVENISLSSVLLGGVNIAENWYLGIGVGIFRIFSNSEIPGFSGILHSAYRADNFSSFVFFSIDNQMLSGVKLGVEYYDRAIIPVRLQFIYDHRESESFTMTLAPDFSIYLKPGLSYDFIGKNFGVFICAGIISNIQFNLSYLHAFTIPANNTISFSTEISFE